MKTCSVILTTISNVELMFTREVSDINDSIDMAIDISNVDIEKIALIELNYKQE